MLQRTIQTTYSHVVNSQEYDHDSAIAQAIRASRIVMAYIRHSQISCFDNVRACSMTWHDIQPNHAVLVKTPLVIVPRKNTNRVVLPLLNVLPIRFSSTASAFTELRYCVWNINGQSGTASGISVYGMLGVGFGYACVGIHGILWTTCGSVVQACY